MSAQTIFFRLRIRNFGNTADALVVTSVQGGTNPYLSTTPQGDGASYDPDTGASMLGSYTGRIADWPIGASQRIVTSQLEDAGGRQQLGYRHAFLEWSYDGVTWTGGVSGGALIAGYLTLLRLVNAAEWEYTIQDPMAALVSATLFSPASSVKILTNDPVHPGFLDLWPNRGCLLGGPVMVPPVSGKAGTIIGIQDLGGWTMRVETTSIAGEYYLRPINVYGPVDNWKSAGKISEDLANAINQAVAQFQGVYTNGAQSPWTTVGDAQTNYWAWNGVTVLIDSGSGFVPWKPLAYIYGAIADSSGNVLPAPLVSPVKGSNGTGLKVKSDGTRTLTNGAQVRVRVLTVLPTESCPIFISDHPVTVLTTLLNAVGFAYNASSASALTSLLGSDARHTFEITGPTQLTDLVADVCRMWGIGLRGDDAGELYFFNGRDTTKNAAPTATITAADVVDGTTSLPFELDATKSYKTIVVNQKRFVDERNVPIGQKNSIVDGVATADDSTTFVDDDAGSSALGQLELSSSGMLHSASVLYPTIAAFMKTAARTIFDRFGRGPIALETTLLRGGAGDGLNLGDEAFVNLPQLPNLNYRLSDNGAVAARRMQIVRRTVLPSGYAVRFLDSGVNAQGLPTVPTLSVAASTDAPRTLAQVTISNAATLNGLGYGLRVQMAVTTGAAPSAGQYVDVKVFSSTEGIPTGAFSLSPVAAGSTVYVRARSEKLGGQFSNYGTAANVTLSAVADPTGLSATPSGSDASQCALAWTPGSGTSADLVDIWLRATGAAFSTAIKVKTLPAGSVAFALEGLASGTGYTASVQYRDPRTQDASDPVDVAFTSGGTVRTLAAPVQPCGFCGSLDPSGAPLRDGVFGIAVVAAEYPGHVEVAVAVETAIGSGVYGAFTTTASVPSVLGGWTIASLLASNDGLRRQIKARHVQDGTTASAYTAVITVLPWTPLALPGYPTALVCEVTMLAPSPSTDAGVNARFQITGVDPTGIGTPQVEIAILSSGLAVVSGAAVGTPAANNSQWKVSLPAPGAGPGTIVARAIVGNNYVDQVIVVPEQTTLASPQGTVSVDANGGWGFTSDGPGNAQSCRWQASASSFPADATVAAGGAGITTVSPGRLWSGDSTQQLGALAFGQTVFITIIPFTGTGASGTQLPSIHIRGSYLKTTATKYDTYQGSSFILRDPTITSAHADTSAGKFIASPGSNPSMGQAALGIKISNGVTITDISLYGMLNYTTGGVGTTHRLTVSVSAIARSTQAFTSVGQPETDSSSSSVQLVTVSGLSHTVDTSTYAYQAALLLADSNSTATALELWSFTIGYTQNNQSQGT